MKSLVSVFLVACLVAACGNPSATSTPESHYYTRGIGVYPGHPDENAAPSMVVDGTYRNIALHRAAYHSSCPDHNLTAQLVTDGVVTDVAPPSLVVSSNDTVFSNREEEYMIDGNPYTCNTMYGEDAFLQLQMKNYSVKADTITFSSFIAYRPQLATEGYRIDILGSDDGDNWTTLHTRQARQLEQKPVRQWLTSAHTMPGDFEGLACTDFSESLPLDGEQPFAYLRIRLRMKGAAFWRIAHAQLSYRHTTLDIHPNSRFASVWSSSSAAGEWVYVDLGTKASFDRVVLHWVNKASEGRIQTSDDAEHWTNVADLPAGENLTDVITCKGKARYVRVWMDKSADNKPFLLSEMEVMGKGGLTAKAKPQPVAEGNKLRLTGGNWKLCRATAVDADGEQIASGGFDDSAWLKATVPGTVLKSYIDNGAVPNPNHADNVEHISDSYFNSDFWYRDCFELPADFHGKRVTLHLDGINWKALVYVNGHSVGRQEGAFIRGEYDITDVLHGGENVLAVRVIKNASYSSIKEKNALSVDYNGGILGADNPTFHPSIGWDWITTVRGRNSGIWNDVYLTTSQSVTLHDPFVQTIVNNDTTATLTPEVILRNHLGQPVKGVLRGRVADIEFEQPYELGACEEKTVTFEPTDYPQLASRRLALWWPNGYGGQALHEAMFAVEEAGTVSDECRFKVGVRQMAYDLSDNILKIYINGRRFIGRGGNWGFSEQNLSYRKREFDAAVAYHADMHFTMIRNWVGQIGDEAFYDACDKYGIMVWQDFWLANPCDGPDPDDNGMFVRNAVDMVRKVRHHPSIALYCGRNEGYPPAALDKALAQLVDTIHHGIIYFPSSADDIVSGHGPYNALPPSDYFRQPVGNDRFHSERGMPCVMNYESLCRTFSKDALWPQNEQWGKHDYTQAGAQKAVTFNKLIDDGFGFPDNAKDFASLAQWVNYNGYRAMFESRSIQRKGLLLWMTHPCWPSMVWQTYDYYLDPNAAYFGCKKANEPLHIQWNPTTDEVEIVNYSAGCHPQLKAVAQVRNMDGSIAWEKQVETDSREDTTNACMKLAWPDNLSDVHYLTLRLEEGGTLVSDNFYVRGRQEGNYKALNQLGKVALESEFSCSQEGGQWSGTLVLRNTTDTPALFVRVNLTGASDKEQILPVTYTDNYFSLMPGEQRTIGLKWNDRDTRGEQAAVRLEGFNLDE